MNNRIIQIIWFLLIGMLFGITLTKSEVISWFRIQEMFRFQSFHLHGVIGSAGVFGAIGVAILKYLHAKDSKGKELRVNPKKMSIPRYLLGGTFFGMGWALTGACPGPIYILIGNGFLVFTVVLLSAVVGTFVYGLLREKLPH